MSYPEPPESKSHVKKAGLAIAHGTATQTDFDLVDRWRSSHGYVINTFQAWIKGHFSKQATNVEFAQRLKRRNTVIDKIMRKSPNGSPLIADVSAMHDFAGCRLIFDSVEDLKTFREYMHSSKVMKNVNHTLRYPPEKYDYIDKPKLSGYRGIHDVYRHLPRGSKRQETRKPWDGLLVEIQYRTRAQHAWATAVEISDIIDGERTKFETNQSQRGKFFAIASEIIARKHEDLSRAFVDQNTEQLQKELQKLEDKFGILRSLSLLRQFEVSKQLKKHNVLNIRKYNNELVLEVISFDSPTDAINKATELEHFGDSVNAVYVRSDNPNQLRSAYRNYFNDPIDFVQLLSDEAHLDTAAA